MTNINLLKKITMRYVDLRDSYIERIHSANPRKKKKKRGRMGWK